MSAHKSRFFQHADSSVVRVSHPAYMRDYEEDPTVTEVQVVPLDAIVIRRDELPEVTVDTEKWTATANGAEDPYTARLDANPGWAWHYGVNAIAVSEYLREHPPVDEAQVKALKDLRDEWYKRNDSSDFLEFLASRGVRVEKS